MEMFTLLGWSLFGLVVFFIWQKVAPQPLRLGYEGGVGSAHISIFTALFAVLLTLAVIFLFNQIWNDLNDFAPFVQGDRSLVEQERLLIHTLFVVPVLVIALILALAFYHRSTTSRVVTLPYFIGAVAITIRLLFDASVWVIREYERAGIYVVLGVLIVVFSTLIIVVQRWWQRNDDYSTQNPQ